jgi:glutamate/tyrosine decarboxylase-like PLP-dependent enzyme
MVDAIADYYAALARCDYPVKSRVTPGYLRPQLPASAPEAPESFEAIMRDVQAKIMPGVTHWQHPNFYAFFSANSSPPALLGDMLSNAINCIGFSWVASPAATELETVVMDWLVHLLGLPAGFKSQGTGGGVIQGTASEATLVALVAARAKALAQLGGHGSGLGPAPAAAGDAGALASRLVCYASEQAHSSVKKAVMISGLQLSQFKTIPAPREQGYAMDPTALAAAMAADVAAGRIPFFVVATTGTTSSGAFDPIAPIAAACRETGEALRAASGGSNGAAAAPSSSSFAPWLHVDAAWAGAALICPEHRGLGAGLDGVDSWDFNPHKWLRVNFDCSALFVRQRHWLLRALSITPEYLRSPEYDTGLVSDYRDWQVPLGRRFRSLKLWFALRMYGARALREHVRSHVAAAEEFAASVRADSRFELAAPPSLGLVTFRLRAALGVASGAAASDDLARANAANEALLEAINASGRAFLVHTKLSGAVVLRLAVGGSLTTPQHVRDTWHLVAACADKVAGRLK